MGMRGFMGCATRAASIRNNTMDSMAVNFKKYDHIVSVKLRNERWRYLVFFSVGTSSPNPLSGGIESEGAEVSGRRPFYTVSPLPL